jgi:PRTRC genetic system ThiF family protein
MNTFDHAQMIQSVTLVGLGGTGSQLARSLCRVIYDLKQRRKHVPVIRFVDPDRIEPKNLGRQAFSVGDIGDFKSAVIARRFCYSLGLEIEYFTEPFNADKHADRPTFLIGAVDNHLARREMARSDCLALECGNHKDGGQVSIGNTGDVERVQQSIQSGNYRYLPNAGLLFPSLLEPDPETEAAPQPAASCAELVEIGAQSLLVNDFMACAAAQYIFLILNHLPVCIFLTFIDSETLSMRSLPISPDNLEAYLKWE